MRISDWSSDVCSSDLGEVAALLLEQIVRHGIVERQRRQAEPGSQRRADRVITAERYARRQAAQTGNQLALLRRHPRIGGARAGDRLVEAADPAARLGQVALRAESLDRKSTRFKSSP